MEFTKEEIKFVYSTLVLYSLQLEERKERFEKYVLKENPQNGETLLSSVDNLILKNKSILNKIEEFLK